MCALLSCSDLLFEGAQAGLERTLLRAVVHEISQVHGHHLTDEELIKLIEVPADVILGLCSQERLLDYLGADFL